MRELVHRYGNPGVGASDDDRHPMMAPGRRAATSTIPPRSDQAHAAGILPPTSAAHHAPDAGRDLLLRQVMDAAVRPDLNALPSSCRAQMERSFGADFSDVAIDPASSLATSMGAEAVTDGRTVHFAPGRFEPESAAGRELIGHELAHVVQQRQGRADRSFQAYRPGASDALEREADEMGARAARGESATIESAGVATMAGEASPIALSLSATPTRAGRRLMAKFAVQLERQESADHAIRIAAINFSGRTDSPFPDSMGAHTTAWVVHCDHVRAMLLGCTLDEALAQLMHLGTELEQVAEWTWKGTDWKDGKDKAGDSAAKARFRASHDEMVSRLTAYGSAKDEATRVSHVQRAIAAYLEARNFTPLATIDTKATGGNTEGVHRANLPDMGGTGAGIETAWNLFDAKACAFAVDADEHTAPGTHGVAKTDRVARAVAGHAVAIRAAYPAAFGGDLDAFLSAGIARVLDYRSDFGSAQKVLATARGYVAGVASGHRTGLPLRGDQSAAAEIVIKDGTFTAINAGRPDSPFSGTQGAHTTAWVVHEDALNTAIGAGTHGNAKLAAQGLLHSIAELDKSPLSSWVANLPMSEEAARERNPATGGEQYARARRELNQLAELLQKAVVADTVTLESVQIVARALLQVENLYPMATTASGGTNPGRGERSLRGLSGGDFVQAVFKNLDLKTAAQACEENYEHKRSFDSRLRGVKLDASYACRIAHILAQHLFYVKAANPGEFAKVEWFPLVANFLSSHLDGAGTAALACKYVGLKYPLDLDLPDEIVKIDDDQFEFASQAYNEESQELDIDDLDQVDEMDRIRTDAHEQWRIAQDAKELMKQKRLKEKAEGKTPVKRGGSASLRGRGRGRGGRGRGTHDGKVVKKKTSKSLSPRGRGGRGRGGRGRGAVNDGDSSD